MATSEEIREEVAELGRLTQDQEQILYSISLRQEELGRQPTIMLRDKFEGDPVYQGLVDREMLTYQLYDHGGKNAPKVVNLIVTLKGMRYCIEYGDEIYAQRKFDAAGNVRK